MYVHTCTCTLFVYLWVNNVSLVTSRKMVVGSVKVPWGAFAYYWTYSHTYVVHATCNVRVSMLRTYIHDAYTSEWPLYPSMLCSRYIYMYMYACMSYVDWKPVWSMQVHVHVCSTLCMHVANWLHLQCLVLSGLCAHSIAPVKLTTDSIVASNVATVAMFPLH